MTMISHHLNIRILRNNAIWYGLKTLVVCIWLGLATKIWQLSGCLLDSWNFEPKVHSFSDARVFIDVVCWVQFPFSQIYFNVCNVNYAKHKQGNKIWILIAIDKHLIQMDLVGLVLIINKFSIQFVKPIDVCPENVLLSFST